MLDPEFLFQTGPILSFEKLACAKDANHSVWCAIDKLSDIPNLEKRRLNMVPVGSVEFIQAYAKAAKLTLPVNSLSYDLPAHFIKRALRQTTFAQADPTEFVKPISVKTFTGSIKSELEGDVKSNVPVWASEPVKFDNEYRFYIQNYVNKPEILGWTRYDELDTPDIKPNFDYVMSIVRYIFESLGPNAYSIDIGYRKDINEFDLVELNDAWALGFYSYKTKYSQPPTDLQYASMLVSRWTQILFCNLV